MSSKDAPDAWPVDDTDWSDAWQAVSRLDAVHRSVVRGLDAGPAPNEARALGRRENGGDAVAASTESAASIDPNQLARAVAEIEKASAALRRSEPALEPWRPGVGTHSKTRNYLSVWIVIGSIWLLAMLLLSAASGAILFLLG